MFHQIRQSQPVVIGILLVGMLLLAAWVTLTVSTVEAQRTTSHLPKPIGPTPTPLALTCNDSESPLVNHSASSDKVIVKIGDFVWHDQNENGLQDENEPGVPDITCGVCQEGLGGAAIHSTTTDANGAYELSVGVSIAGSYYLICASLNDQYVFTLQNTGDNDADSDFEAVESVDYPFFGQSDSFLLIPGQDDDHTQDAGLVLTATNSTPMPTSTAIGGTLTPSPTPTSTQTTAPSPTPTSTQTTAPSPTPTSTETAPSATPTATSTTVSTDIDPDMGGTLISTDAQDNETTIEVPGGAVTDTTTLLFTPNSPQTSPNLSFAGHAFTLDAEQNGELQKNFMFNVPITVTINYNDEDIVGIDEDSILLYYWEAKSEHWLDAATTCSPNSTYQRDLANNTLSVAICHLTDFALFGAQTAKDNMFYLPVIQR